ncbi:transcriptional regulator ATRX homolog [Centruroides sculpturatus]|uniref:transcriptional regulator ATRX homolog n=1 Tax=Centruroides sculpturatus TaxID=218467 RepID=UPI000C6D8ED7|nr:transcriptional regulator ATRX homolog [Centruroides sculpturatus]
MKKRRRIKQMSQSSEDNSDDDVQIISENQDQGDTPIGKGRKNIRKLISDKMLREETKAAAQAELERKRRILERQKAYNHTVIEVTETGECVTKKLVLEVDEENKEEIIQVHPSLIVKLKPHQVEGVKFMWEGTIESLKQLNSTPGSGCILAHCMGLGKTLQVIVFTHTLLTNEFTKKVIRTCLVICPYNTILNWAQEYETWLDEDELKLSVSFLLKNIFKISILF